MKVFKYLISISILDLLKRIPETIERGELTYVINEGVDDSSLVTRKIRLISRNSAPLSPTSISTHVSVACVNSAENSTT